jgi:exodeoxyribonuclease VII large subunit
LLEKTRRRLEAEGLFAPERKRALPYIPAVIGVITSPTGAVIRDILHRLANRFPSRVLVWPVMVQGSGSAEQVAAALRGFAGLAEGDTIPRPDLLIVARGGGSIEDLWSFNEEVVVRAIAASPIPVISAVGHETDTTLADHAADRRAPTPTAAAEIAVPVLRELVAAIDELGLRLRKCAHRPLTLGRERLDARLLRMPRPETLVAMKAQKLDEAAERLRRGLADRASRARHVLQDDRHRLSAPLLQANWRNASERLAALQRVMRSLDPDSVLQRGYARVTDPAGRTLTTAVQAGKEAALTLRFRDGEVAVVPGAAPKKRPAAAPPPPAQPKLL